MGMNPRLLLTLRSLLRILDELDRCPRCVGADADQCHARVYKRAYDEARAAVKAAVAESGKRPN